MKKPKRQRDPEVRWKSVFRVLKRSQLPWLWIAIAFGVNLYYNELLVKIPTTTASLFSGDLTSGALRDTVVYYVLFALVMAVWNLFMARRRAWPSSAPGTTCGERCSGYICPSTTATIRRS